MVIEYVLFGIVVIGMGIQLIFFLNYLFKSFKKIDYDQDSISFENEKVKWTDIRSISVILSSMFWSKPNGTIQIKANNGTFSGTVRKYDDFVEFVNKTNLFEIAQTNYSGKPMRWKKKGLDYERTGYFDWKMDQEYIFNLNKNQSPADKKISYTIAIIFFILAMFVLYKMF